VVYIIERWVQDCCNFLQIELIHEVLNVFVQYWPYQSWTLSDKYYVSVCCYRDNVIRFVIVTLLRKITFNNEGKSNSAVKKGHKYRVLRWLINEF
jgi:hypothetical protein